MAVTGGRVVLIGESNVGKTSLIQYYLRGEASPEQKETVGAVFHSHETDVEKTRISMQIWDTAGQERYRSLGPIYYRKARAAIGVFDLTRRDTMTALEGWIRTFREKSDDQFVVVAANKADLEDKIDLTMEETSDWARTLDTECIWTSSVTGDGVAELFGAVSRHLYDTCAKGIAAERVTPKEAETVPVQRAAQDRGCC
jgi:small GTP-binding protein